jgi:tRNA-specific 2-thiouridylase
MKNKPFVIIGMSGGVDSSVAAYLLLQEGYRVEGLFMKNWEEDDSDAHCQASIDVKDAEAVCDTLGIPLHRVNFSNEYWDSVFEVFLQEYKAGRTPNPDILCNKEIKFKAFLDYAMTLGADFIATGHYAKKVMIDGQAHLVKGADGNKDQSYFLYALNQKQIAATLFPLGELEKSTIRETAKQQGFLNHDKKDSTGICFIGEKRFKSFLQTYLPAKPGDIVTDKGECIGQHEGLMYYTMGQRKGVGIGGLQNFDESPWYVIDKDLVKNQLIVAQGKEHPALYHNALVAAQLHWINAPVAEGESITAKTRYRQADQHCTLHYQTDQSALILFEEPQRAITPGQSVVFYNDDVCLGGGIIEAWAENEKREAGFSR